MNRKNRTDLVVDEENTKSCLVNGKLHCTTGPAVEYANGDKFWYSHGILHRIDGPAVEFEIGYKEWWIEGKELTEKQFNSWIEKQNNLK